MLGYNDIFFSIVIPLYNKEKEIQRTVDSVLWQTWKNFELIVVDDGSTDSGATLVGQYTDSRIRLIRQANAGVSAARNKGIECSTHDFVAFLDADDVWKRDFLQIIHRLICLCPGAGAYATAYELIDAKEVARIPSFSSIPPFPWEGLLPSYFRAALEGEPIHTSAVVVPKSVLLDVGNFPLSTSMGEDKDVWERIALKYPIAYSRQIGATYHLNSSNRISKKYFSSIRSGAVDLHASIENRRPFYLKSQLAIKNNTVSKEILLDLREYIEKYKIISAELYIKFAGKSQTAREILKDATPRTKLLKKRKNFLYALSFVPQCILRRLFYVEH